MTRSVPLLLVSLFLLLWPAAMGQCLCSLEMPFTWLGLHWMLLAHILVCFLLVLVLFCLHSLLSFSIVHHQLLNSITHSSFVCRRYNIFSSYSSRHYFFQSQDYWSSCYFILFYPWSLLALSPISGTALSASSGRQASIFNPPLLHNTQRICMGSQCVSNWACLCNCIPSYFHLLAYQSQP